VIHVARGRDDTLRTALGSLNESAQLGDVDIDGRIV
jgi:hypothetical protein